MAQPPSGSFSDLYDAMQQKKGAPIPAAPLVEKPFPQQPPAAPAPKVPEVRLPATRPPSLEPRFQGSKEARKEGTQEPGKPGQVVPTAPPHTAKLFDITQRADRQNTYQFTTEELWAIEDLAQELGRRYDVKISKYDVVRCGVHMLIEDYRRQEDRSFVIERVIKRRKR